MAFSTTNLDQKAQTRRTDEVPFRAELVEKIVASAGGSSQDCASSSQPALMAPTSSQA